MISAEPLDALANATPRRVAVHCPRTLRQALRLGGAGEKHPDEPRIRSDEYADGRLCLGPAGTCSLTRSERATQLCDEKPDALDAARPDPIVTTDIGCHTHLNGAGRTPVRHWIERVDNRLVNRR